MKITERVKSYADVCAIKGIDPVQSLPFPEPQSGEERAINSFTKIIRTIEVLNEGWKPDWTDHNQPKFYAWFRMYDRVSSGVGFSFFVSDFVHSCSDLGSRLVLKNEDLVYHLGEHFLEDYKGFMVIED